MSPSATNAEAAVANGNGHNGVDSMDAISKMKAAVASQTRSSAEPAPAVWLALKKWLPAQNDDLEYWWGLTGLHLAIMLEAAGYTTEKQYNALLFHYHWIVRLRSLVDPNLLTAVHTGAILGSTSKAQWDLEVAIPSWRRRLAY